jgi:hypothetical protein
VSLVPLIVRLRKRPSASSVNAASSLLPGVGPVIVTSRSAASYP